VMSVLGAKGYFLTIAAFFAGLGGYAAWRMTQRAAPTAGAYAGLTPTASSFAVGVVLEQKEDGPQ
jgi:hypothetical protein